eukprot:gnl/Trimastix_PCT/482.p1 GENE.gnl/Trimastix_PCT/482~~gnl/Trimastix_PCT/482.p1  ORF type:complete len:373 (+),score=123.44 gnl/Trimastix_PCT/482:53-1171(+)
MDVLDFELLNDAGIVLSPQERLCLKSSIPVLHRNNKFKKTFFWGKVSGVQKDYYIAQGFHEFLAPPKSFFSIDGVTWAQLPEIDEACIMGCHKLQELFTGDPNFEYMVREDAPQQLSQDAAEESTEAEENDEAPEEDEEEENGEEEEGGAPRGGKKVITHRYTEDQRLAVMVSQLDYCAAVVPRGFLTMNATHHIIQNRLYAGLCKREALTMESYLHQREPENTEQRAVLDTEGLDRVHDFLDPIDEDIPKGCWALHYEPGSSVVVLNHLLWPGFSLVMRPDTPQWGRVYFGTGVQNVDFAFMANVPQPVLTAPAKDGGIAVEGSDLVAALAMPGGPQALFQKLRKPPPPPVEAQPEPEGEEGEAEDEEEDA